MICLIKFNTCKETQIWKVQYINEKIKANKY